MTDRKSSELRLNSAEQAPLCQSSAPFMREWDHAWHDKPVDSHGYFCIRRNWIEAGVVGLSSLPVSARVGGVATAADILDTSRRVWTTIEES